MELNVTRFFNEASPRDYSASRMEIGDNAARDTWQAACDDSVDYMILDTEDKREAFREYVGDFGAWSDEEIRAWSDSELNALLLQMISSDIREGSLDAENPDWDQYQKDAESGRISGRLFKADDGTVTFYIGA